MEKIEKIVLIKNAVETLGYFSEQIAIELEHLGMDVYFVDYDALFETVSGLAQFISQGNTALITFNFIGLSKEDVFMQESGVTIWEENQMHCINILVDHPLYYHSKLRMTSADMQVYCIDREHVSYIRRFYPGISVGFLPTAGNVYLSEHSDGLQNAVPLKRKLMLQNERYRKVWNYENELIPYEKRSYDVVFTANYVSFDYLCGRFDRMDAEYAAFYRGILEDLIAEPAQSLDNVLERHIRNEFGEVSDMDMREAMAGMGLIDLCVRTYYRGEVIRTLAESGIKVHIFGADWEQFFGENPENIVYNGRQITSSECVLAVRNAKITLNVMPWFKDGAHDRIFTAMLNRSVAVTDDSRYLREEFLDGADIVFFSLKHRDKLPEQIHTLLCEEEMAKYIAENGYQKAIARHTWRARAGEMTMHMMQYKYN